MGTPKIKFKKMPAKSISYGSIRNKKTVEAIAIHYTGNNGDTAEGNGNYYAHQNTRQAGAHFYVDRKGNIVRTIPMNRIAWAVGGSKWNDCAKTGGGKYYGKYGNSNTVSIELCDVASKEPSAEQIQAVRELVAYIRYYCPNATKLIRHFDVNGKYCPARFCCSGKNDAKWASFKDAISKTGRGSKALCPPTKNHVLGDIGDDVGRLQTCLNALGYDCGNVDKVYGAKTERAVLNWKNARFPKSKNSGKVFKTKARNKLKKQIETLNGK